MRSAQQKETILAIAAGYDGGSLASEQKQDWRRIIKLEQLLKRKSQALRAKAGGSKPRNQLRLRRRAAIFAGFKSRISGIGAVIAGNLDCRQNAGRHRRLCANGRRPVRHGLTG